VTDPASTGEQTPPPRAFSQGVGLLMQTVGVIMFLTTCCICGTSGLWDPARPPQEAIDQVPTDLQTPHVVSPLGLDDMLEQPAKAGLMLLVVTMSVGGLAMAGFGLGLQAQRRESGIGSLITCSLCLLTLILAGLGLWSGDGSAVARITHAFLTLLMLVMVGFTWTGWQEIRKNPPPGDIDIVPPGTKIPYSIYHDDPPDVRMAKELAQRRAKLEAEQRELEKMEEALKNQQAENDRKQ